MTDIQQLGTIMGIWAHPDDETFTSGGIMAKAVENGQKVIVVTATHGEKGIQDETKWPADKLGDIRASELSKALEILGVQEHCWLDCKDGECATKATDQMSAQLSELIDKYQPDTILTFAADGLTGHPDHQAVSKWAVEAARSHDVKVYGAAQLRQAYEQTLEADERFNIFFNVTRPVLSEESECDVVLNLTPELLQKKCRALQAMPSQYEKMSTGLGQELFEKVFSQEAFKLAVL